MASADVYQLSLSSIIFLLHLEALFSQGQRTRHSILKQLEEMTIAQF